MFRLDSPATDGETEELEQVQEVSEVIACSVLLIRSLR